MSRYPAWVALTIKMAAVMVVVAIVVGGGLYVALSRSGEAADKLVERERFGNQNRQRIERNTEKIDRTLRCLTTARDPQSCIERVAGPQGPGGATGRMGRSGVRGQRGLTGQRGEPGRAGARGRRGADRRGLRGLQGSPGEDGRDGIDGLNGTDGRDGARGPVGPPIASWTFTDATGVTQTCIDPEGDLIYTCTGTAPSRTPELTPVP